MRRCGGRLETLGVYRASGHEHLTGSLVIPLFDAEGRVVQLYGRKIRDDLREGTPKHLYLSGPHRGVFNREGLAGAEDVIVCEALIDALTFWVAGYAHVTSSYGVEVVPDELVEAIATSGAKRVRIAFDRDEAGDRGAEKLAARLEARGARDVPGAVSEGDGRQPLCAEGGSGDGEPGPRAPAGGVDGPRRRAEHCTERGGPCDPCSRHSHRGCPARVDDFSKGG